MIARVDVVVAGGHDEVVAVVPGEQLGDAAGHGGAAGHRQRAALAEVVLDVDDDQRAHQASGA